MNQKELEYFREEMKTKMSSNYNVILKERKLPMSLLTDNKKVRLVTLLQFDHQVLIFFSFSVVLLCKANESSPTRYGAVSKHLW